MSNPAKYEPVFHFTDLRLYQAFIDKLPRNSLLEMVKKDEQLRKRCFSGFRISDTVPNASHIASVLKREVVQNRNSVMANSLCENWLSRNTGIVCTALETFGIISESPSAVATWLKTAQEIIATKGVLEVLRPLVKNLRRDNSADETLIFISIVGHGRDQKSLRDVADQELRLASESRPTSRLQQSPLEAELHKAINDLALYQRSNEGLQVELSVEMKSSQEQLQATTRGHLAIKAQASQVQLV